MSKVKLRTHEWGHVFKNFRGVFGENSLRKDQQRWLTEEINRILKVKNAQAESTRLLQNPLLEPKKQWRFWK